MEKYLIMPIYYYPTEKEALDNALTDHGEVENFTGKNCEEDGETICSDWDGESRRCECGNRRVLWVAYKNSDGWYAIAEAW